MTYASPALLVRGVAAALALAMATNQTVHAQVCDTRVFAADGELGDEFGAAVALSGDLLLVGVPRDETVVVQSGSAYVFDLSPGGQAVRLVAADASLGDRLGSAVALDADTALVGAYDQASTRGAAYVFTQNSATGLWSQEAKLVASDAASGDQFGYSVAIRGDVAVVGARYENALGDASGSVYVFERVGTIWAEVQKLTASDGGPCQYYGTSVAIADSRIVVGAERANGNVPVTGAAYVLEDTGSSWQEVAKLVALDGDPDDQFGASVDGDGDGDTIVVGAPDSFSTLGFREGAAYVFTLFAGTWYQVDRLETIPLVPGPPHPRRIGSAVALGGDYAVVGAPADQSPLAAGPNAGAMYVHELGFGWRQVAGMGARIASSVFGESVDVDQDRIAVGAPAGDGAVAGSGVVIVYDRHPLGWGVCGSPLGDTYCGPGVPNSSGASGTTTVHGSMRAVHNDLYLHVANLPPAQFGYFLTSETPGFFNPPGSDGILCLSGNIGRFSRASSVIQGPSGATQVDLDAIPVNPPQSVISGQSWHYQCWYRDVGNTSNFTDAVRVTFL